MEKYKSYHFSPLNNRSMLMPRIPKGEEYKRGQRIKLSFEPFPEDKIDKENPYFQANVGFFKKKIRVLDDERKYALYVPEHMTSKCAAVVLFPESGVNAEEFLMSTNWKILAESYHVALIILESDEWNTENVEQEFDYAWKVVDLEFNQRLTVDICESFIYPIGLGDGAYIATSFAMVYSATFPAFAADGDCNIDVELLEVLKSLPSDGCDTKKKRDIALPGFMIDRTGNAENTCNYLKAAIHAREEGLYNKLGRVYLENPEKGAYFVNEQPIAQVWLGNNESVSEYSRDELNEEMLKFVLKFARWGGFGNNHLRLKRTPGETGVTRVYKEIEGLSRYWDIYVPSCYRSGDGKEYPLVVAIHGFSCNSEYFEQTSDWHRLAEERGFFVVYPSAYPRNTGRSRFPLPGWCVWPLEEDGIDESVYFSELLDYMEFTYSIDKKRIYAVGHSNGGRMTQTLSRTMPERFAAFVPTGSLGGNSADAIEPINDHIQCPIWFMMGEFDLSSPEIEEGSIAKATLETYCKVNHVKPQFENWYDNGNYHTLVMYDDRHLPMVQYTIIRGCPHTYTAEMAQLAWDTFLCHYSREENGIVRYQG